MKALLKGLGWLASQAGILFMKVLAYFPLAWTRALGCLLGWVLYALVAARRRVVLRNLAV